MYDRIRISNCCWRWSLRFGTIFTGVLGIVLSICTLIFIFLVDIDFKMIVVDIVNKHVAKIILAVNLCMTILISSLLIAGVIKRIKFLMLPWIVLGLILAIGLLISVLWTAISHMINVSILGGFLWLILGLVVLAIYVYLWVVVVSYYNQLKEEKLKGKIDPYGRPYTYRRP